MSAPVYDAYRDSGIDWLGKVPNHWSVGPLKAAYSIFGGATPKSEREDYWDGGVPWVTPADLSRLTSPFIGETLRTISEAGLTSCAATLVPADSVVLSTRAPIGSIGITAASAATNQGCKALVSRGGAVPSFLAYTLSVATEQLRVRGKGTTFLELSGDELGRFQVPTPPPAEQAAIAAFLDRETGKIDALVEAQTRLIELLKEKRQAVISHAVTKGLDPAAPMKDSGVEWLGQVPEHWEIVAIKRIARLQSGDAITSSDIEEVGTFPVYGGNGFRGFTESYTHDGDFVLIGRQGALCGNINYAQGRFWASEHAIVAHPRQPFVICWFGELLRTMNLGQYSVAAAQPGLSADAIGNLRCPRPPIEEQAALVHALDRQLGDFGGLIDEAEGAVALLQERRVALISAAVTGKIDVRGVAPEQAEAA